MNDLFRKSALPVILLALAGCATQGKPPPTISLDDWKSHTEYRGR